jgi:putative holliday junction resolvase
MRVLGVDYGTVRVGLALSDELGMLATPLEVVPAPKAFSRIKEIVTEKQAGLIIMGMPRNMDGSYGFKAEEVKKFAESLGKQLSIPIKFWDERLTTQGVEKMLIQAEVSRKRRKEVIDQLAAQQILQSYLDSQVNQLESETPGEP